MRSIDNESNNNKNQPKPPFGYIINERGEEIPITEEMVAQSMRDIKLQSIGTYTGYTKAITDDMLPEPEIGHS